MAEVIGFEPMMRESKTRALTAWQHLNKCYTAYRTAYGKVRRLNSQIPRLFTAGHVQDDIRFLGSLLGRMKPLTVDLGVVNENRTRNIQLGRLTLYQLSYYHITAPGKSAGAGVSQGNCKRWFVTETDYHKLLRWSR